VLLLKDAASLRSSVPRDQGERLILQPAQPVAVTAARQEGREAELSAYLTKHETA